MVFHGSASHDFNPVDEAEVRKVGQLPSSRPPASCSNTAARHRHGTGADRWKCARPGFGTPIFAVATRSPLVTEDLIFRSIRRKPARNFSHVGVYRCPHGYDGGRGPPGRTELAMEYTGAAETAFAAAAQQEQHRSLPRVTPASFSRSPVRKGSKDSGSSRFLICGRDPRTSSLTATACRPWPATRFPASCFPALTSARLTTTDSPCRQYRLRRNQVGLRFPVDTFYPMVEETVMAALAHVPR